MPVHALSGFLSAPPLSVSLSPSLSLPFRWPSYLILCSHRNTQTHTHTQTPPSDEVRQRKGKGELYAEYGRGKRSARCSFAFFFSLCLADTHEREREARRVFGSHTERDDVEVSVLLPSSPSCSPFSPPPPPPLRLAQAPAVSLLTLHAPSLSPPPPCHHHDQSPRRDSWTGSGCGRPWPTGVA